MNIKSKYGNKKVIYNGIEFDSIKEKNRYVELTLLARANEISGIIIQPKFLLQDKFEKNGKKYQEINYIADFAYYDNKLKKMMIEDTKGMRTDVYKLKKKLFEYKYKEYEIKEL